MRRLKDLVILSTVSAVLSTGFGFAQDRDDHRDQDRHDTYSQQEHHDADHQDADRGQNHFVKHDEWRNGYHMPHEQWESARKIDDWRAYHLQAPPSGYEWRYADGYYILANADGVIFTVVPVNADHY